MNFEHALQAALEATNKSRQILRGYFGKIVEVEEKPGAGLVSEADRESERIIKSVLSAHLPEASFLGEESGLSESQKSSLTWIVDPLDGTHNFVSGFPIYCTSIALVENGEPVVGVVDVPELQQVFSTVRNQGAFLNGRRLKVTGKPMKHSLLGTGFSYQAGNELNSQVEIFRRFMHQSLGVRRPGAAALDLCWVASGAFGGFWERGLKPWDLAAGWLMIREAGGVVTEYDGSPIHLESETVLAGAPHLHKEMHAILNLDPSKK
jgi:myo-inositol-1(or 4)-monophosphatase